ncbi:uncharacterized protein LOC108710713 [Xenopus laevis]|uniref:Uncharacterized protein LOC108710713 n=2 Tax=Xenopus laevis TaxID=8355 RepID=A0A8J1MK13_XENLA|nr:uncharacterized protein LOC108710713 [Xenopus laevis]
MSDLSNENSAEHPTDSPDIPELARARHFEHIAHMNVFDSHLWPLRIPVKLWPLGPRSTKPGSHLSVPDAGPANKGDDEDSASGREDNVSLLLDQVRRDLQQMKGQSEEEEEENWPITSPRRETATKSGRKNAPERKKKSGRTQNPDNREEEGWERAKGTVEEFLDFPGIISALSHRKRTEPNAIWTKASIQSDQTEKREPASIPNTRHNALFLRDYQATPYWQILAQRPGTETTSFELGQSRTSPSGKSQPRSPIRMGSAQEELANGKPECPSPSC